MSAEWNANVMMREKEISNRPTHDLGEQGDDERMILPRPFGCAYTHTKEKKRSR
jgi:hypothetical protein